MHRRIAVASVLGSALIVLSACSGSTSIPAAGPAASSTTAGTGVNPNAPETNSAGDIPDTTVFVPFHSPSAGWTVSIPQGWARSDAGGAVVFTDKLNSVRLQTISNSTAPTEASVKASEVPQLLANDPTVKIDMIATVTRKSGPVIVTTYTRDSAPNPVTGKVGRDAVQRYDFYHNGTELVVTLSGPVGADNVDPWRTITDSVTWAP